MSHKFEEEYFQCNYHDYLLQNPPSKLNFYRFLAESAVAGKSSPKVLEIGCAFGQVLATLDPSWELFGLDVSSYAITEAKRHLVNIQLKVSSALKVPFEDSFDLVLAFDVLEHVYDLSALATAIDEKLAPGGQFIFVVPVYDGPTGPFIKYLDKDETHLHRRSRDFWLDWATKNFDLFDWLGIYRYLLFRYKYLHFVTRRFRRWTPAIAVTARKIN